MLKFKSEKPQKCVTIHLLCEQQETVMQKNRFDFKNCMLCPRACGVNRTEGERGVCGQTDVIKAARAGLHMWEEPCISGSQGSGTVFCFFHHKSADGFHSVYGRTQERGFSVCGSGFPAE